MTDMASRHAATLNAMRNHVSSIVALSAHLPASPGPKALLEAIVMGACDAGVEFMGGQATYETIQPILDGVIGEIADKVIAKAKLKGTTK